MGDIWFISDQHYSHKNFLTFTDKNGNKIRPFNNVEEMDELMIKNHNERVKSFDKVYFGGDVVFGGGETLHKIMPRLLGKKRLILGNHDIYGINNYLPYFEEIYSARILKGKEFKKPFVICHYPLHKSNLMTSDGTKLHCVHGHIHQNTVMNGSRYDPQYVNICVEKINYAPVNLEQLYDMMGDF